jgi:nicotinate-nucleotide adenylyltransferase
MNGSYIGVLGGSFNPIHLGHLLLAQNALESFDLQKVLFMPCHIQPHKAPAMLAPASHRAAMVEYAITGNPAFEMLDIEIARGGTSFAIDSVKHIRQLYPESDILFIIGADTLTELHLWHNIEELLQLCSFATIARPGYDINSITPQKINLPPPWPQKLLSMVSTGRMIDISSSDIRHRVAESMSIRYLVPPAVEMYIHEHKLYCN